MVIIFSWEGEVPPVPLATCFMHQRREGAEDISFKGKRKLEQNLGVSDKYHSKPQDDFIVLWRPYWGNSRPSPDLNYPSNQQLKVFLCRVEQEQFRWLFKWTLLNTYCLYETKRKIYTSKGKKIPLRYRSYVYLCPMSSGSRMRIPRQHVHQILQYKDKIMTFACYSTLRLCKLEWGPRKLLGESFFGEWGAWDLYVNLDKRCCFDLSA